MPPRPALALALALAASCNGDPAGPRFDPALEGLAVSMALPSTVLPGTTLVVKGRSFVGQPWGEPSVLLRGQFDNGSEEYVIEARAPATFVDFETLEVAIDDELLDLVGSADGEFDGTIRVDIDSAVDGKVHSSSAFGIRLSFRSELTPSVAQLGDSGPLYVNDWIVVAGDNLLLGGDEGSTMALVEGCFRSEGGPTCLAIDPVEVEVEVTTPLARTEGRFAFSPAIAGLRAGGFEGRVTLRNRHPRGNVRASESRPVSYQLLESAVFSLGPSTVTLGQYLQVEGAGFVGGGDAATLLQLIGEFTPADQSPVPIDVVLVPEYIEGRKVRYTINEDDALGQMLDLRYARGVFNGQVKPIVSYHNDTIEGTPANLNVALAPVRQVIYLRFTEQYSSALHSFGLRAVDAEIRDRVLDVVQRDYRTLGVELRTEPPEDYSLYSEVEIGGPDPNGLGLLGYDNTPGKDVGNLRLHDRIGGVNATTQQDGYPGFGGVFIESLFIFSEHPGAFAPVTQAGTPIFDDIFDPFRPDRGGEPVRAADLSSGVPVAQTGIGCPAEDRRAQIACAVWVLGNLVGSTISHEIGHSLGLANPSGGDPHLLTDGPNRLMDAGSNRPFEERAELGGLGPASFCQDEYDYLRVILPTADPDDSTPRSSCF